jgi:biotin carboxyl carrier protein
MSVARSQPAKYCGDDDEDEEEEEEKRSSARSNNSNKKRRPRPTRSKGIRHSTREVSRNISSSSQPNQSCLPKIQTRNNVGTSFHHGVAPSLSPCFRPATDLHDKQSPNGEENYNGTYHGRLDHRGKRTNGFYSFYSNIDFTQSLKISCYQGTIVEWTAQPGQAVKTDDVIALVETDKVTIEIKSVVDGVLTQQFGAV